MSVAKNAINDAVNEAAEVGFVRMLVAREHLAEICEASQGDLRNIEGMANAVLERINSYVTKHECLAAVTVPAMVSVLVSVISSIVRVDEPMAKQIAIMYLKAANAKEKPPPR